MERSEPVNIFKRTLAKALGNEDYVSNKRPRSVDVPSSSTSAGVPQAVFGEQQEFQSDSPQVVGPAGPAGNLGKKLLLSHLTLPVVQKDDSGHRTDSAYVISADDRVEGGFLEKNAAPKLFGSLGGNKGGARGLGNRLGEVWVRAALASIASYAFLLFLFGYWGGPQRAWWAASAERQQTRWRDQGRDGENQQPQQSGGDEFACGQPPHDLDGFAPMSSSTEGPPSFSSAHQLHYWSSLCAEIAFAASGFRSFLAMYFSEPRQRPALLCTLLVNVLGAHSHNVLALSDALPPSFSSYSPYLPSLLLQDEASDSDFGAFGPGGGGLPVLRNLFGRAVHAARLVEWISLNSFLMCIVNALDCPSWPEFRRSVACQTLSIAFYLLSVVVSSHFSSPVSKDEQPLLPSFYFSPDALSFLLLLVSSVLFLDLFRVLKRRVQGYHDRSTSPQAQALLLTANMAITWTVFPIVFALGVLGIVDHDTEQLAYTLADVCAKFVFVNVVCEAACQAEVVVKQRAFEAQRQFLRYVFHEVRVPLNTIRLGLESVQQGQQLQGQPSGADEDYDDTASVLACMGEAVETMSDTLDDVLSYQKIEEGKVELSPQPFEIASVVRLVAQGLEPTASGKGLVLHAEVAPDAPERLIGDSMKIRQVLSNFASNAIKFSNAEGGSASGTVVMRVRMLGWESDGSLGCGCALGRAVGQLPHEPLLLDQPRSSSSSSSSFCSLFSLLPSSLSSSSSLSSLLPSSLSSSPLSSLSLPCAHPPRRAVLEWSVQDCGVGILPEDQRKLFQPFSQIRAGDLQAGRGSGLGLCICKNMVHLMGGSIGVRSALGKGSTFFFTAAFPLAEPLPPPPALPTHSVALVASQSSSSSSSAPVQTLNRKQLKHRSSSDPLPTSSSSPSAGFKASTDDRTQAWRSKIRILIVDDVTSNRKMMRRCVAQLGYCCEEAVDGTEAVSLCAASRFDLVLMDNVMPRMTGIEATAIIRENEERRQQAVFAHDAATLPSPLRIFGVTGNALSEDVADFKRAGCDEVLTKPLRFETLKRALDVHALLNPPP